MTIASNLSFIENSAGAITTGTFNIIGLPFTFGANSVEYVRIDSSGNLDINTATSYLNAKLSVNGNAYVNGILTATTFVGAFSGSVTQANNLNGGLAGYIPMQTAAGATSFIVAGTAGQLLQSNGTTSSFVNTATIFVGAATSATNIFGGAAGGVHYQSGAGLTTFLAISGTAGALMTSNGSTAPAYITQVIAQSGTGDATAYSGQSLKISAGGAGVTGDSYFLNNLGVGGNETITGTLRVNSTNYNTATNTSNALYVVGGIYADGGLTVGGSGPVLFKGPVTFSGTATYVYSTQTIYTDNLIELHTPPGGVNTNWNLDDGKDIGLRFHYYTNSTDTNAALVLANDTKYLEWYNTGAEGTSTFSGSSYGTFKTGQIILAASTGTASTNTGALQVVGGVGIGGGLYVGGTITATNFVGTFAGSVTGAATQVNTVATLTNATFYPAFVNANNASPAGMGLYTTGSFVINPGTGFVGIGTSGPAARFEVSVVSADATLNQEVMRVSTNGRSAAGGTVGRSALIAFSDYANFTLTGAIGGFRTNSNVDYSGGLKFFYNGASASSGVSTLTEGMRLDSSGNLGLGVTPNTWYTTFKAIQFGANGSSIFGRSENNTAGMASNAYINAAGAWTYINTNYASYYQQLNGQHQWYIAPSGTANSATTFTTAMTLDNSGNVGISTTSPSTNLTIGSTAASGGASGGLGVFLSRGVTTNFFEAFDGTKSYIAGVDNTLAYAKAGTLSAHDLAIITGNSSKIYVQNTTSNVGISTTTPNSRLDVRFAALTTSTQLNHILLQSLADGANNQLGARTGITFNNRTVDYVASGGISTAGVYGVSTDNNIYARSLGLVFYTSALDAVATEKLRITSAGGIAFSGAANYGTSGQILQSNGDAAPTWVAATGLSAGSASQVQTVAQTASASYYPTFVSANNASATAMSVYTTSSFSINPGTGQVLVGSNTFPTSVQTFTIASDDATLGGAQLHITGATTSTYRLRLGYNTAGNYGNIQSVNFGVAYTPLVLNIAGISASPVLIGTSTQTNGEKLGVLGGTYINGAFTATGVSYFGSNVGVGTTTPATYGTFVVSHTGSSTTGIVVGDIVTPANATGIYLRSTTTASIAWASGAALTFTQGAGGTERMRIDSVGTVGIGETSPITYATTGSLVITNTTYRPEIALRTTTAIGGTTAIKLGVTSSIPQGGAVISSYISAVSGQPTDMIFSAVTSGTLTERLRITSNGGIAFSGSTNYGSSGQVLQSNGDAAPTWVSSISGSAGSASQVTTVQQTANASYYPTFVSANNASATAMSVYTTSSFIVNPLTGASVYGAGAGFVDSYGTANNTYKLIAYNVATTSTGVDDVIRVVTKYNAATGASAAVGNGPAIVFAGGIGDNQTRDRARIVAVYEGSNLSGLAFHTQTTADTIAERVRIQNNGNVGIGTTTPAYKLQVAGANTSGTPLVQFNATGSGTFQRGVQLFNTSMAAGDSIMYSVGTADSSRQMGQMYYVYSAANSTSNRLSFGLHSVDDVINILGSGNVMIGTTTDNGGKLGVNGEIRASNEITAYYSSDIRLKENIRLISDPISKVNQIRGVHFDWTDEHIQKRGGEDSYFVRKNDIGVIAQEVEAVLPELVAERDDGTKVVKYEKLVALLIEAVKEQQKQINQISQALERLASK